MNEDFVSFELAKKLKEKGYPMTEIPTGGIDNRNIPILYDLPKEHPNWQDCKAWWVPTISQVLKWLRDEKNIHIDVGVYPNGWNFFCCSCEKHNNGKFGDYNIYETLEMHNSYELAALAGIEYVLDNFI